METQEVTFGTQVQAPPKWGDRNVSPNLFGAFGLFSLPLQTILVLFFDRKLFHGRD